MTDFFDIDEIFLGLPENNKDAFVSLEKRLWHMYIDLTEEKSLIDACKFYQSYIVGYLKAHVDDWNSAELQELINYPMISNQPQHDSFLHKTKVLALQYKAELVRDQSKGHIVDVELNADNKDKIRLLVNEIKEKLTNLDLEVSKKEKLFDKLNLFLRELDRERTRLGSFLGAMLQVASATGESAKKLKPVVDQIEKIKKIIGEGASGTPQLPKWEEPKQLEDKRSTED